ncbi:radical SAM protein [Candidatus Thorarchaeota archaeon]|nr:MAG: radical SAM protein [Candidatus Thorarchaeota archaeon]
MRYEGSIWRPPSEARSLILQATVGCSHNACIFCVSYKKKQYRVRGVKGIREDLASLSESQKRGVRRVFLADGNALAMETGELVEVLNLLSMELPSLERVGIYGYAKDVREKSIDDLRRLNEADLGIIYFGLETGDDRLLRWARKGVDRKESVAACKKIRKAGIPLSITIILGLGGPEKSERHAISTAEALNEIDPEYVGALTLMTPTGTRIHEMIESGEFELMSPMDILAELRILLQNLDLSNCIFRTNHASNYLPIAGTLGRDKHRLLETLDKVLESGKTESFRPDYARGL